MGRLLSSKSGLFIFYICHCAEVLYSNGRPKMNTKPCIFHAHQFLYIYVSILGISLHLRVHSFNSILLSWRTIIIMWLHQPMKSHNPLCKITTIASHEEDKVQFVSPSGDNQLATESWNDEKRKIVRFEVENVLNLSSQCKIYLTTYLYSVRLGKNKILDHSPLGHIYIYIWKFLNFHLPSTSRQVLDSQTATFNQVLRKSLTTYNGINTLRPRQNGRHFADDIFKCIFLNEIVCI